MRKEKGKILIEGMDLSGKTTITKSNILDAPRSIFMNLIAKQINLPLPYEWWKSVTKKEYIDEMINIFNDNKKLLKNIWWSRGKSSIFKMCINL